VVGEANGKEAETVYIAADLETVDELWPGLGMEIGLMMKLLEDYGTGAWGVDVLTVDDLGLKVGEGEDTEEAFRRMDWSDA
jgi:hypothetical protein